MLATRREIAAAGLRSRMLLQVHDELLFEVAAGSWTGSASSCRRR